MQDIFNTVTKSNGMHKDIRGRKIHKHMLPFGQQYFFLYATYDYKDD